MQKKKITRITTVIASLGFCLWGFRKFFPHSEKNEKIWPLGHSPTRNRVNGYEIFPWFEFWNDPVPSFMSKPNRSCLFYSKKFQPNQFPKSLSQNFQKLQTLLRFLCSENFLKHFCRYLEIRTLYLLSYDSPQVYEYPKLIRISLIKDKITPFIQFENLINQ